MGQMDQHSRHDRIFLLSQPASAVEATEMARWEFAFDVDRSHGVSVVRQIARAVAAEIQRGRLRPGDRLPGSRTLARTLRVHRQTVVAAFDDLAAEGWLVSKRTSGTFVASLPELPLKGTPPTARLRRRVASQFGLAVGPSPSPELPRIVPAGTILMSGMRPDVRLVPVDLIGRTYRRALRRHGHALVNYGHPAGLPRLREALAAMLSATRGLAVEPSSILITRGSQMALALTARALTRPGDLIAVEHPGYRPAWEAFRLAGAEIVPVRVDEHGLDVEALQRLIARRPIRAVYVTPHHQYPTTVTLSASRRIALRQLSAQERFAIIEDDYDHEFHYSGRPVLPIACDDSAGLIIYVGTLSKVLAPGLRIGFIAAPADLIERLVSYRSFIDLQGDAVIESAVAELFEEGLVQRHVARTRRIYHGRLKILADALRTQLGDFLTFREPRGGTAIWVRTRDAGTMTRWAHTARLAGVAFDTGAPFTLGSATVAGARLGFACLNDHELREAARRLAAASRELRRS
jgi:GntR family transcriptional regulator/MocR family aminotransferase